MSVAMSSSPCVLSGGYAPLPEREEVRKIREGGGSLRSSSSLGSSVVGDAA